MRALNTPQESERRRRVDPSNYFDAGEVSILRTYFGLALRRSDPPLATLYAAEDADDETAGPVRLWRDVGTDGPVNEVSNAVARICLTDVQERLPQWAMVDRNGKALLGRKGFEHVERLLPLEPQRLLCINWADSGPGFSWPEDYYVTLLPGFDRYVVTASSDSTDSYGVTDFAIGWFAASEDVVEGGQRVLLDWWRYAHGKGQASWAYLFDAGLIDRARAKELREKVWGHVV